MSRDNSSLTNPATKKWAALLVSSLSNHFMREMVLLGAKSKFSAKSSDSRMYSFRFLIISRSHSSLQAAGVHDKIFVLHLSCIISWKVLVSGDVRQTSFHHSRWWR